MAKLIDKKLYRVIDANFNRAKEGLRVCEDVSRFLCDQPRLTRGYKNVRHGLTAAIEPLGIAKLLQARDIVGDVGRGSTKEEFSRRGSQDILYANSQRVKESIRVLEEFAKLIDLKAAVRLKKLRYRVYDLEKRMMDRNVSA